MTGRSNMKWINCANHKSGMTLVEVVAGLMLLATLLASLVTVKAGLMRQNRLAERRREAVSAADQLLAQWWQNPKTFPRSATGATPSGLLWQTRVVPNPAAQAAGAQVVRLEVSDESGTQAALELLLPTWGQ
jgi:Tfp pilus assembly protein PilV